MRQPSNAFFAVAGTAVWSAGNFFMNSAMAKRGSVQEVAVYALATAVATPICDFSFLGLRGLQNSDGKGEYSFGEYLALRLLGIAGSLLVLTLWMLAQGLNMLGVATLIFGLRACMDAGIDIYHGLTQKLGRLDVVSVSLGLRGVFGFAAFYIGLLYGGIYGAFWGQLLASVGLFLLLDRPYALRLARARGGTAPGRVLADGVRPAFRWPDLRRLLTLALPVAVTLVIISLNSQIGRYFAGGYLSKDDLNVFSMIATLVALERVFVNAIGVASSTGLGEAVAAEDRAWFCRLANRLMGLGWGLTIVTGILAAVAGRPLVSLIFRPEYARDPFLIVLVLVAGGIACVASAQGYVLTALRVLRAQVPIYGTSLLVLLAANALLVPRFGTRGAGYAMLLGALVTVVGSQIYISKGMRRFA